MVRTALTTASAAFILVFGLACPRPTGGQVRPDELGGTPREVREDPKANEALERATQLADSATTPTRALELYLEVRKAFPDTTAAQEAAYRAGVLYFEAGDFVNARKVFNELLFGAPLFDKGNDARLKLGLSALEIGAYRDAFQNLASLAERLTGPERRQALAAAARAAEGAHLFADALVIAIKLGDEAQNADEKAQSVARITELVEGKVGFLDVAKVKQAIPSTHPAWPILTFKLARIYYHLRDWKHLEETLRDFLREHPSHPFAPEAQELLSRSSRRTEAKPNVIGLVLPMTGKYKQLGEVVLKGVQLALRGTDLELVVKDSQGDVNLAGKLVEELAFDEGAIAIIGPLLNEDARRAALVAEELQIPIITLSKADGITDIGPHVFRNMLTSAQQASALARYAQEKLGFKTFAMLYPNLPFGVEMANQFWDEVVAGGAQMRGAESYDHDQTTYAGEVKKLVGRYYLDDRSDYIEKYREVMSGPGDQYRKRKALEKIRSSLDPIVDFQALLIPDSWQRVGLVAPALAVEDIITNACDERDLAKIKKTTGKKEIKAVTLLGVNTWNSPRGRSGAPELLERGGKFVHCSVFVDGFYAESKRPATKRFVSQFQDHHRDAQLAPVEWLLAALGHDSAAILRHHIDRQKPRTRAEMLSALGTTKDFEGATGKTSFNEKREAVKPLFFLRVDKDGVEELSATDTGS